MDDRHFKIWTLDAKARLALVVEALGGQVVAADHAGVVQSRVSAWLNRDGGDLPNLLQLHRLEAALGERAVSEWMAGSRPADGDISFRAAMEASARLARSIGDFQETVGDALADGRITPAEERRIADQAAALHRRLDAVRASCTRDLCDEDGMQRAARDGGQ